MDIGSFRGTADRVRRRVALRSLALSVIALAGARTAFDGTARAAGDAARGEVLYQGCEDCHSIDKNDVGPLHRGVVGRVAGTVPDYNYSPALRASKLVWTEHNLDKWLADPQAVVPGTKMFYEVDDPKDRADLIAFLKERAK
jgi:cytochrome c